MVISKILKSNMRVLVTGSNGFIGKNLCARLSEIEEFSVLFFDRNVSSSLLEDLIDKSDAIIHLAGENRPRDDSEFDNINVGLTKTISRALVLLDKKIPVFFASSTQAELNNPYGKSKYAAEVELQQLSSENNNPVVVFRLPGVFGKWCKPNYNSVVATFCHNIVNNLEIKVNNPSSVLKLIYIDDLVNEIIYSLKNIIIGFTRRPVGPEYSITLGELANKIGRFKHSRSSLMTEKVGDGLTRALYATYVSYFSSEIFSYSLPENIDSRGKFVEVLKTPDSGQFSFFTALPGITRGSHYHHTKTEKFLVIKGTARFKFRNIMTNEYHEILTSDSESIVVETVPGWVHDITNVGDCDMIVMLWANEIFNPSHPDTISCEV